MIYEIVWGFDRLSLENQINGLLERGWRLQGGICVTVGIFHDGRTETHFYQALIKDDPNRKQAEQLIKVTA